MKATIYYYLFIFLKKIEIDLKEMSFILNSKLYKLYIFYRMLFLYKFFLKNFNTIVSQKQLMQILLYQISSLTIHITIIGHS